VLANPLYTRTLTLSTAFIYICNEFCIPPKANEKNRKIIYSFPKERILKYESRKRVIPNKHIEIELIVQPTDIIFLGSFVLSRLNRKTAS